MQPTICLAYAYNMLTGQFIRAPGDDILVCVPRGIHQPARYAASRNTARSSDMHIESWHDSLGLARRDGAVSHPRGLLSPCQISIGANAKILSHTCSPRSPPAPVCWRQRYHDDIRQWKSSGVECRDTRVSQIHSARRRRGYAECWGLGGNVGCTAELTSRAPWTDMAVT